MAQIYSQVQNQNQKTENTKTSQPSGVNRFKKLDTKSGCQFRQDYDKKRFPPNKKEMLIKKESCKNRANEQKVQLDGHAPTEIKVEHKNIHPIKNNMNEFCNSLEKVANSSAYATSNSYHAVGQSQRQKLMGVSPEPQQFGNQNKETSKQNPL